MHNGEPNMSDTTLLVSVEDLINRAMGPPDVNVVNFKLIQMVLQILAWQQRMLKQRVEIKVSELAASFPTHIISRGKITEELTESSASKTKRLAEKRRMADIQEEREKERNELKEKEKTAKTAQKEQEKAQKEQKKVEMVAQKEQEKAEKVAQKKQVKTEKVIQKEQVKAEKATQKEQEKAEKFAQREQEKAEKLTQKEQEKAEKLTQKEQEKAEKAAQREQEKAEKAAQKEQEKAEKLTQKEQEKEQGKAALKENTQKGQEKAEKAAQKEQEKAEKLTQKEQEKAEKLTQKEQEKEQGKAALKENTQKGQEKAEKVAQKEQEKAEKAAQREQEKAEKAAQKEQEKAEKLTQKEQEKEQGKAALKENTQKGQEKAEKAAQKEQEKAEKLTQKEQEKAEKLTQREQEKAEKAAQKEQEKGEKVTQKEQEKEQGKAALKEKTQKGQEKAEKAAQKEQEKAEKLTQKEQEKAEKLTQREQEKAEKAAQKEQEKGEKVTQKEQEKEQGKAALKEKTQKGQEKAEKVAQKEQEKGEKVTQKEQSKAEKAPLKEQEKVQKGQEKAGNRVQLENEKAEKKALKEKEKIQKESVKAEKEAEKEIKRSAKEQEKADKEKARAEKEEERERERERSRLKSPAEAKKGEKKAVVTSDTGISIKETLRGKESVIVVEKGPTTRSDSRSRTNIDVVTQTQFALLEAAVKQLKDIAVPKPLAMPDNKKLRSDLVKGTASLPVTMEAMQVAARVKAAEAAIDRMTGLLTNLSAAGALPHDLTKKVDSVVAGAAVVVDEQDQSKAKHRASTTPKKSVLIDPKISEPSSLVTPPSVTPRLEVKQSTTSTASTPRPSQTTTPRPSILSRSSIVSMGPGVTHEEMDSALRDMREEMSKNLQGVVSRAATTADNALHTAMNVANKLDVALKLDLRISSLFTLVSDYAEQLSGFDAGLTTQMQSFKDQIGQMRTDLRSGLEQLENVNNNAETAAVLELTECYTELVGELDTTLCAHNSLQRLQGQLGDEMHSLVECVEMLREQKCDRDEVLDGLRDKADISRLSGLLSEVQFAAARADFERRLDLCYEKFRRQDAMWMTAITDLTRLTDQKAELIELLSLRDLAQKQLQDLHDRVRTLAFALGEPKAALLTRLMSRGAWCGACGAAALMEPQDADAGAPSRLPPLRAPPAPEEPCARWVKTEPPLERHTCHRWVGGSHTLVRAGGPIGRESAATTQPVLDQHHVLKYTGYGDDGRLYMMEEDLKPCIECNMLSTTEGPQQAIVPGGDEGAGDAKK